MNNINNLNSVNEPGIGDAIMKIPPFTRYYLGAVILTSFLITYPIISIVPYMLLEYYDAFFKFQIWRLVTNFFIVGKFSFGFLFFMMLMYQQLNTIEKKTQQLNKYSEFVMLIFYLVAILLLLNLIFINKKFLPMELLFSLIYVDSKRDPDKMVSLWGFVMRSKF